MAALLVFLCAVIAAYWVFSDSQRVRAMAEEYLSEMLGGPVMVEQAHLSLFDGLRLDGVRVFVDRENRPDSLIFSARSLLLRTGPLELIRGRLRSAQITALAPEVYLCENVADGQWNYRRLARRRPPPENERRDADEGAGELPQVLLRGGVLQYSRIVEGRHELIGSLAIDGQLTPEPQKNRYRLEVAGRAPGAPFGPRLNGTIQLNPVSFDMALDNLEFDRTIEAMLPAQVQQWWQRHQLAGAIRVPRFRYAAGRDGSGADFDVVIEVDRVRLVVAPEELLGRREYHRARAGRPGLPVAAGGPFGLVASSRAVDLVERPRPIEVRQASGRFHFTPQGVRLCGVTAVVENNRFALDGEVRGYSTEAPLEVRLAAPGMVLPAYPRYLRSLPSEVQNSYEKILPQGRGDLAMVFRREAEGGPMRIAADLHILDGSFRQEDFPYPLERAVGHISLRADLKSGSGRIEIHNLVGRGVSGSLNEDARITVNGWIAPLDSSSEVRLSISGQDIWLDGPMRAALPPDAREAVAMFDAPAAPLRLRGNIEASIHRPLGQHQKARFEVRLDVREGQAAFEHFPYPLRELSGRMVVHNDRVEVKGMSARHGEAAVSIEGVVLFGHGRPTEPRLTVTARDIAIDEELLAAVPEEQARWLRRLGLRGRLDIDGNIVLSPPWTDPPADGAGAARPRVDFGLSIQLRDGSVWPLDGAPAFTAVAAALRLSSERLSIVDASGRLGDGSVRARGAVGLSSSDNSLRLDVEGRGLAADKTLYALVPERARGEWDELQPSGTLDADVHYAAAANQEPQWSVVVRPRALAIRPRTLPWPMHVTAGELRIEPSRIVLKELAAAHGQATVRLAGTGSRDPTPRWDLQFGGRSLTVDEELLAAVPSALASLFRSISLRGLLDFDVPSFSYRLVAEEDAKADSPLIGQIDFSGRIDLRDAAMDAGIALSQINGTISLDGQFRDGELHWLSGKIQSPRLMLAQRPASDLRATLLKPAGRRMYKFSDVAARVADGELAAQIELAVPASGASRYAMALTLREMDVRQLTGEADGRFQGRLTASLDMAGQWDDAGTRRGRGDVEVQGRDLYRIPLVLGLLQITNLSLPIKSPFTNATVRYSVEGRRVNFERIELLAPNMLMQGNGWLDFVTRKVSLVFTTDNPNWPTIPILSDLVRSARNELLQIQVRGSIQEPQVTAKSMNTLTTTVDEVFSTGGASSKPAK